MTDLKAEVARLRERLEQWGDGPDRASPLEQLARDQQALLDRIAKESFCDHGHPFSDFYCPECEAEQTALPTGEKETNNG